MTLYDDILYYITRQTDMLRTLEPFQIMLISIVFIASLLLYLGEQYAFYSNFVIIQALVLILVYKLSRNHTFTQNTIYLAILLLLHLVIIFFNLKPLEFQSTFSFLGKLFLVIFILLNTQMSSNNEQNTNTTFIAISLFTFWILFDLYSISHLDRSD